MTDLVTRLQLNASGYTESLTVAIASTEKTVSAASARIVRATEQFGGVAVRNAQDIVRVHGRELEKLAQQNSVLNAAQDGTAISANRSRAAYQQLGFQLSDVVAQASNGTSAFVILAQQGGQTAAALSTLGGRIGGIASFLAGPWGAAVFGAVTVLGLLTKGSNDAEKATGSHTSAVDALCKAMERQQQIGKETAKQLRAVTAEQFLLAQETIRGTQLTYENISAQIQRQKTKASERVDELLDAAGVAGFAGGGLGYSTAASNEIKKAEAQVKALEERQQAARAAGGEALERLLQMQTMILRGTDKASEAARSDAAATTRAVIDRARASERASRDVADAQRELARENAGLVDSFSPLTKAANEYEAALRRVNEAQKRGLITAGEAASARFDAGEARDAAADTQVRRRLSQGGSTLLTGLAAADRAMPSVDMAGLGSVANQAIASAGLSVAEAFEDRGLIAAQSIAQAFGGKVGDQVSSIVGLFRGIKSGDYTSAGGQAGGLLTLFGGKEGSLKSLFAPAVKDLGKFGVGLDKALGGISKAVPYAAAALAAFNFIKSFNAPIGIVSLNSSGGKINRTTTGNNSGAKEAIQGAGNSTEGTILKIIDQLGGELGDFSVSIGKRKDSFRVDTSGKGNIRGSTVTAFDNEGAAIAAALRDAIRDGAVAGISATAQRALQGAKDTETGVRNAILVQSVGRRLREIEDPLAGALEGIEKEFRTLLKTLDAAGASAGEFAELEKLMTLERKRASDQQLSTLREFKESLTVGGDSPFTVGKQLADARARFAGFEADIAGGKAIDDAKFTDAARALLDLSKQANGATSDYFVEFDRVQTLTTRALDRVAQSAKDSTVLAEITSRATQATANGVEYLGDLFAGLPDAIAQALRAMGGGGGFIGSDYGYAR